MKSFSKPSSELRFDIVSNDWVVIATGRAQRPEVFTKRKKERVPSAKNCPFCHIDIEKEKILYQYPLAKRWRVISIPNKYPAFSRGKHLDKKNVGPYKRINGIGFHEVVVFRNHIKELGQFSTKEMKEVIDCYHERYLDLMNEKFVNYVAIFNNKGRDAGASIYHPHSQIVAIPTIDADLRRSLKGSRDFFNAHKKCVHCAMVEWDLKDKKRIIFENKEFVVLAPFVPRVAFEIRIYPKDHLPYFERITNSQREYLAEAFKEALYRLYKALNSPPYNFFLHAAPCDGKNYDCYHWHWEILPKTQIFAGFELGTGIEISTIEPESVAEFLKKV